MTTDSFKTRGSLQVGGKTFEVFSLDVLAKSHPAVQQLPSREPGCLGAHLRNLWRLGGGSGAVGAGRSSRR